jgi:uncharacterized protein YlxW (UPF0749 family)
VIARLRGLPWLGRVSWRDQVAVTVVAAILGLLVVVQLRTQQADPGLSALTAQELTVLVANLNTRNEQLRGEVSTLERELSDLSADQAPGQTTVEQIERDLGRTRAWAGLEAVTGRGIAIAVSGPIDGAGVEEVLNELRNAGAEAMAVGGVRVVNGTVVAGGSGSVSVENTPLGSSFEILAIGNPETLTGSLTRIGGVISLLAATHPGAILTVSPIESVNIPATTRSLAPIHGAPRL